MPGPDMTTEDSVETAGSTSAASRLVREVQRRTETVAKLLVTVPHVSPATTNDKVLQIFESHPEFYALPVVQEAIPEGMIHRHRFVELFVRPYYREVHGKRPCTLYMDPHPLIIESSLTRTALGWQATRGLEQMCADGWRWQRSNLAD